jgi:hypothetical protein
MLEPILLTIIAVANLGVAATSDLPLYRQRVGRAS